MEAVERTGTVIVGAGVCGLKAASRLSLEGLRDFVLLDKQAAKGGIWTSMANASSRVQISEPSYRLMADRPATAYTPQGELLEEMDELCRRDGIDGKLRFGCEVVSVRDCTEAQGVEVRYRDSGGAMRSIVAADHVLLCTGGLQQPREVAFAGEGDFRGHSILGMRSEIDATPLAGRHVLVLGMGAFAVENARTALLAGAGRVTIVARTITAVVPRLGLFMSALAHGQSLLRAGGPAAGAAAPAPSEKAQEDMKRQTMFLALPYQLASAPHLMPAPMKAFLEGKPFVPPANAKVTIPVCSDVFFLALKLGRLEVVLGEVESFQPDGVLVREGAGAGKAGEDAAGCRHIPCDVVVKCFGFEAPDPHLDAVVGCERIRSPLYITEKVLLMKVEHNPQSFVAPGALGLRDGVDIGGSATVVSDMYMETFLHFRAHPEELPAVLERLPHPKIHEDSYADFGAGLRALLEVPALAERAKAIRAKYAANVRAKYPKGLLDFMRQNKADWEDACAALADGDRQAVPYFFDMMLQGLERTRKPAATARL